MKRQFFAVSFLLLGLAIIASLALMSVGPGTDSPSLVDNLVEIACTWFEDGADELGDTSRTVDKPNRFLITEWPLRTKITSGFGPRLHPIFHRIIMHQGIDFRAKWGQDVHTVLDGVVVHAGKRGGFGNAVYVFHPVSGNTSVYAHLSRVDVAFGDSVHQGQVIGKAGASGYATGVHLHFGVKNSKGKWTEPLAFLRKIPEYQLIALKRRSLESPAMAVARVTPKSVTSFVANVPRLTAKHNLVPAKTAAAPIMVAATSPSALNASMLKASSRPDLLFANMTAASARSTRILTGFAARTALPHTNELDQN